MNQTFDRSVAARAGAPVSGPSLEDPRIIRAVREYLAALEAGERPDRGAFEARYAELAPALAGCLEALEFVRSAASSLAPALGREPAAALNATTEQPPEWSLRDYRIVREIGRGGMGVVYEAVQVSLGRHVALKVLPVEAARDAKLRARFEREARAAAQLHHSNIVPVFEVGQEGNASFYAMQYIQGKALDQVIQELQQLRAASGGPACPDAAPAASAVAQSLLAGRFEPARSMDATLDYQPEASVESEPTAGQAAVTPAVLPGQAEQSLVTSDYRLYCRNVARLGLQVAEALAYAHGRGIVHRDIKPSNLLLDTAGIVWVSDFGLAKTQEQALTETGDLVGTVRYMAPERFGGVCDARADVYALGLTLYELLLLRPAFDAPDRLRLIDQIGHQEPARPRSVDSRIPRDLETILMKAIEKDPRRRYASAEAVAEELRCFLADEPIQARRIGPLERLGRWGRRNPLVAGLGAAVVLVTALGFVGVLGQWQVARANERQAQAHAAQAEQQKQEAKNERDEAQRQRDEVQALNEKLQATQVQLRNTLYAAHMNLARHAWEEGSIARVQELLEQHRPKPGEPDLRGFEWHYLHRLCHAELLTLKGHTADVTSVAFSPDGKRLASASRDNTVKVWDAHTGHELLTIQGASGRVAFSLDGKRLASASRREVKVWEAQTGQELLTLKGGGGGLAFSPDGKRLASASSEEVKVWDAQTGQELLTLPFKNAYGSVAFSPDGKRLAGAAWDSTVKVWDVQTGQELLSLKAASTSSGSSVAFSPDGKRLAATVFGFRLVQVWDAQTGQDLLKLHAPTGWFSSAVFSPDGKRLACGLEEGSVKLWDAQTGYVIRNLHGHTGYVTSVAFSPDGKRLASASRDNTVKVWDAQRDQENFTLQAGSGRNAALSPDFRRLASASTDYAVKVWDAQTGQQTLTLKGLTAAVNSVAFSPDGKRLAIGGSGKWMPGGGVGTNSGDRAELKVWDAQTGQELLTLPASLGYVRSVAFSPDGKRLASASRREVKVWEAQTGQELLTLKGGGDGLAFSPDGKRLASGSTVWDAQTGQELLTIRGAFASVTFSPDGKRLASASGREVKVWDAQTGRELLALKGHTTQVTSVTFSPDGKRVASACRDNTVKVWDAQTGQELLSLTFKASIYTDNSVAFSPDGKRLARIKLSPSVALTIHDATPLPEKP